MSIITREMLASYLEDALGEAETASIEQALRGSEPLRQQLRQMMQDKDRGEDGSALPDKVLRDYAAALSKAGRYDEALATLDLLRDPNTAEALNYRGYATRKLGRLDEGIGYYQRSVALDPRYALVREYLGEAYVIKGDMASAEAQLRVIKGICGTDCAQYKHLADAIADPSKI